MKVLRDTRKLSQTVKVHGVGSKPAGRHSGKNHGSHLTGAKATKSKG